MATDMETASGVGSDRLRALFSFVDGMIGERPTEDNGLPPGPWSPIIRDVVSRMSPVLGPIPDPWLLAGLNPQPLPPLPMRWAFITAVAEAAVSRIELIADMGAALGSEHAAPNYLRQLTDELCPPPRRIPWPKKIRWPAPPPPRPEELTITASDLMIISTVFEAAAHESSHAALAEEFTACAKNLGTVGAEYLGRVE